MSLGICRTRAIALALVLLSCGSQLAAAQDGWYSGGGGGIAWFADDPFQGSVSGPITQTFAAGYAFWGATGYRFARAPVRLEGEVGVFHADVEDLLNTVTTFQGGSDRHLAGMVNLYYEPSLGAGAGRIAPYAGAGLGGDAERWGLDLTTPEGVRTAGRFDERTFFAYQVKAGVTCRVTERLGILGGYRYFRTQQRELDSPSSQTGQPHSAQGIHLLEVGFRAHW